MAAASMRRIAGLRIVIGTAPFLAAALLAGCGGSGAKEPADIVSGKVTLNGQPVSGQLYFVSADKKEYPSPVTPEGQYTLTNVPKGEYEIVIQGMPGPGTGPGVKKPDGDAATPTAVAPPAKYGKTGSGLKVTVTGGKQSHNIEL